MEDTPPTIQVQNLRMLVKEHSEELIDHIIVVQGGQIRIRSK